LAKFEKVSKYKEKNLKIMPKQNPYIIPTENKKPFETVYELKTENKIPTYEEFMRTYQEDESASDNYYYEIDSYEDIRVVKCYGPGNSQSNESAGEKVFKKVASMVLAASYFTPAVVVTGPLTGGGAVAGLATEIIGHATDNEDAKKVGGFFREITVNAAVDGLSASNLNSGAPVVAKATKKICQGISVINDARDIAEGTYLPPIIPGPRWSSKVNFRERTWTYLKK